MKKVELLAPAKNFKAIKAASEYADSVYFGIEKFNMRMRSDNIAIDNLPKVIDYCSMNGLKTYLTTNILIYDNEIEELQHKVDDISKKLDSNSKSNSKSNSNNGNNSNNNSNNITINNIQNNIQNNQHIHVYINAYGKEKVGLVILTNLYGEAIINST